MLRRVLVRWVTALIDLRLTRSWEKVAFNHGICWDRHAGADCNSPQDDRSCSNPRPVFHHYRRVVEVETCRCPIVASSAKKSLLGNAHILANRDRL